MAIKFNCSNCAQKYELEEGWCGKTAACVKCGFEMQIPFRTGNIQVKKPNESAIFNSARQVICITTSTSTERHDDINFRCKICGQRYRLEKKMAGQLAECGRCQRSMIVPRRSETGTNWASGIHHTIHDSLVCWCHTCGQKYRLSHQMSGSDVRCTRCREHFKVPNTSETSPPSGLVNHDQLNDSESTVLQHDTLSSIAERSLTTMDNSKVVTSLVKYVIKFPIYRVWLWKIFKFIEHFNRILIFPSNNSKIAIVAILIIIMLGIYLMIKLLG